MSIGRRPARGSGGHPHGHHNPGMAARISAFLAWGLAAAAGVYWGLLLFRPADALPPHAAVVARTLPAADPARVLGSVAAAAPAGTADEPEADDDAEGRFVLLGVVAGRGAGAAREGIALLSVDGKPPRAYRVGQRIEGEQVVQSVGPRSVQIGPRGGPAQVALELPPPAATATRGAPATTAAAAPPAPAMSLTPGAARMLPIKPGLAMPQPPAIADDDDGGETEPGEPPARRGGPGPVPR